MRTHNIVNTVLPSLVTTQVLRIVLVQMTTVNGVVYLRLEALGCPASQGMWHLHTAILCVVKYIMYYYVMLLPL